MTIRCLAPNSRIIWNSLPMSTIPIELSNVTAHTKANIYFDGQVMSHTLIDAQGVRKTLGLIQPGTYHFGTAAPEHMEIVAGACTVVVDGTTAETHYVAGQVFDLPCNSGFNITSTNGVCEYICTFL